VFKQQHLHSRGTELAAAYFCSFTLRSLSYSQQQKVFLRHTVS